ncbi:MAG TPA: ATP-dependent DNA ligase [Candidatus Dormibacteraeota bacterium]|nr:ATP-dependent DNA ligase [Candidatus Dormibacteraeota bacterium]
MLLQEIAETSAAVADTAARLGKIDRLAATLRRCDPHEVAIAVAFLTGELRQRQIGVGYASLRDPTTPAAAAQLTLSEVDATFARIGAQLGAGSQKERRRLLAELMGRATAAEQRFLWRLLLGDLRQGALEGVMVEAVARAAEVPAAEVRRALMLRGDLGAVAEAALREGTTGLRAFTLHVGRPVQPMLAQTADSIEAALERISPAGVEWKLDGVRAQIHRQGGDVRVFTRSLDDITARVPELVEAALALPVDTAVLDGEAIALQVDGRPHPFQVTAGRLGSKLDVERLRAALPLTLLLFDMLHVDGQDLLDRPAEERHQALAAAVPAALRMPRLVTADPQQAGAFLQEALDRRHEGVLVKSLTSPYEAGRRGAGWIKVKPRHTLDLVVLAVEWGHGRRRGFLSNLHLGALDPENGGFVMLGKTFKGLTDEMLAWQTERFLELEQRRDDWTVYVRPEQVVEVAFDGVQSSPRYPGGVALRFARVLRYRPDKRAQDADTIETVRSIRAGASGFR